MDLHMTSKSKQRGYEVELQTVTFVNSLEYSDNNIITIFSCTLFQHSLLLYFSREITDKRLFSKLVKNSLEKENKHNQNQRQKSK